MNDVFGVPRFVGVSTGCGIAAHDPTPDIITADDLLEDIKWAERNVAEARDELEEAERLLSALRARLRQRP
jgi:hypothetical protein